jgi:hypothetical protein
MFLFWCLSIFRGGFLDPGFECISVRLGVYLYIYFCVNTFTYGHIHERVFMFTCFTIFRGSFVGPGFEVEVYLYTYFYTYSFTYGHIHERVYQP